ncbi:MAG: nucleoside deaminase [Muribaculaceae bacterium]|nr:nucleoside deaminase [Muribaculaceae bacterium]
MLDDNYYMGLALAEARAAASEGEIPVGAVVVAGGRVIGRGHNQTERLDDVTAHAEMLAITAAARTLGGKYLPAATLYVTVEPCPMCAGAIGWSQLGRIVIGAPDTKRGYSTILRPGTTPFHPRAEVITGVRAAECTELMQSFFRIKRKKS